MTWYRVLAFGGPGGNPSRTVEGAWRSWERANGITSRNQHEAGSLMNAQSARLAAGTTRCAVAEADIKPVARHGWTRLLVARVIARKYVVTVLARTVDECDTVMMERLGHDEDYGFEYYVVWSLPTDQAPAVAADPPDSL